MTISIVLASDEHLLGQAGISAMSAVANCSQPVAVFFLTPRATLESGRWEAVTRILEDRGAHVTVIGIEEFAHRWQLARHLTPATYYRLMLPEVLPPQLERVLYLDCDVLVGRDIADLDAIELSTFPVAAVSDVAFREWSRLEHPPASGYFNGGILLLNLRQLRASGDFRRAIAFAEAHPEMLTWSDQCALNKVFERSWLELDSSWNYQHAHFIADIQRMGLGQALQRAAACVVHFNNYDKPWLRESPHPLKKAYWSSSPTHASMIALGRPTLGRRWTWFKRAVRWLGITWGWGPAGVYRPKPPS